METSPPGTIEPIPPREHRARPKQVLLGFGDELVREISGLKHGKDRVVPLYEGLVANPQLAELLFAANLPFVESDQVPPPPQDADAETIVRHHLKSHGGYQLDADVINLPALPTLSGGAELQLKRPGGPLKETIRVQVFKDDDRVEFSRDVPEIGLEDVILTAKDDLVEMRRKAKSRGKMRPVAGSSFPLHIQYLLEAKGLRVKAFPPMIAPDHDEALYRRVFEYLDRATRIQS